jgi:hypothetical protein
MAIRWPDGVRGVRVQGVNKPRKQNLTELDRTAGDGRFGIRVRGKGEGVTKTESFDGTPLYKSTRKSVTRRRKPVCRLATDREQVGRDSLVEQEQLRHVLLGRAQRRADAPRFRARKGQRP